MAVGSRGGGGGIPPPFCSAVLWRDKDWPGGATPLPADAVPASATGVTLRGARPSVPPFEVIVFSVHLKFCGDPSSASASAAAASALGSVVAAPCGARTRALVVVAGDLNADVRHLPAAAGGIACCCTPGSTAFG